MLCFVKIRLILKLIKFQIFREEKEQKKEEENEYPQKKESGKKGQIKNLK